MQGFRFRAFGWRGGVLGISSGWQRLEVSFLGNDGYCELGLYEWTLSVSFFCCCTIIDLGAPSTVY